jgi:hypothetical protein
MQLRSTGRGRACYSAFLDRLDRIEDLITPVKQPLDHQPLTSQTLPDIYSLLGKAEKRMHFAGNLQGFRIHVVQSKTEPLFLIASELLEENNFFPTTHPAAQTMATIRLTFLYPYLFRSIRISEPASQTVRARARTAQRRCRARGFSTAEGRGQRFVQRHGKAVEPYIPDGETADSLKVFTPAEGGKDPAKSKEPKKKTQEMERKAAEEADEDEAEAQEAESSPSAAAQLSEETQAAASLPGDPQDGSAGKEKKGGNQEAQTPRQEATANTTDPLAPLQTVLRMPPPESQEEKDSSKPPHLQTPPYVHHFDTYTLVQQVEQGGFTREQAITAMKAVRGLLALNLDVAKASLVSTHDVENVSLFQ